MTPWEPEAGFLTPAFNLSVPFNASWVPSDEQQVSTHKGTGRDPSDSISVLPLCLPDCRYDVRILQIRCKLYANQTEGRDRLKENSKEMIRSSLLSVVVTELVDPGRSPSV